MRLNLKDLEETKSFYKVELEKEELAGGERNSFLKALGIIEECIKREEEAEGKIKDKLGNPSKTKNPYLKFNGSIDLIEKFPDYGSKKKGKKIRLSVGN